MQTKSAAQKSDYAPLETAQEALAKGREAAQDAMIRGRDAVQQRVDAASVWVSSFAKTKPLRALGVAAAVGAVVGLLIARR